MRDEAIAGQQQALLDDRELTRLQERLLESKLEVQRLMKALAEFGKTSTEEAASRVSKEPQPAKPAELEALRAHLSFVKSLDATLRRSGADWLRILEVDERKGKDLLGVRVLELDPSGLPNGVHIAKRAQVTLDRSTGIGRIELFDSVRVLQRKRFPRVARHAIEFEPDQPRVFEAELGGLIVARGSYPVAKAKPAPTKSELLELALWKDRLDSFFAELPGEERWTLHKLASADNDGFGGVEVLGYTKKGRLVRRIRAKRLIVVHVAAEDRVELRLSHGFVESDAGRVTFGPGRPYRLPLPGVKAARAQSILTGRVQRVER